jgi:hypothetical protein
MLMYSTTSTILRLDRLHTIPPNHAHAQESRHTTKHQCDNAFGGEPRRQRTRRYIFPAEIEQIQRVTRSVALGGRAVRFAVIQVICGDSADELPLDGQGGLDHGCDETGHHVPFNVAVEQPDAGIVGAEAEHDVSVGPHEYGVTLHRACRERGRLNRACVVRSGFFI